MSEARPAQGSLVEVGVEPLAWAAVTLLFLGMRFAVTWQAPVGAEELPALSGAWQAAHGAADDRFVPTLFQAVSAWYFVFGDSEVVPRLAAFLTTASIPIAIFLLRPVFGAWVPLVALGLLAFDAPGIYAGVAATTSGFDLAIVTWGFVLFAREDLARRLPLAAWAIAGLLAATAGPAVVPLVLAAAVVYAPQLRARLDRRHLAAAVGAALGILIASLGFGAGDAAVAVPPLVTFVETFEAGVSTLSAADILMLYSWPIVAFGVGGAALLLLRHRPQMAAPHWLLVGWSGAGLAWLVAALSQGGAVVVAAATLPCALLAGLAVVAAVPALRAADWNVARFAIPVGVAMALIGFAYSVDWARVGRVGSDADVARVIALFSAAIAALAVAAVESRSRPALLAPALAISAIVIVVGGFGVGLSGSSEPLPSPVSPQGAQVLRALALETREARGGQIVVHPDFRDAILWPFRDSGDLVIASRVPDDAVVVLWPADMAQPEGFAVVEGEWSLLDSTANPTGGWLAYLRWYSDRNDLSLSHSPMAVYIRSE